MTFLRGLWKQRPKQWGPGSLVEHSVVNNCEQMGMLGGNIIAYYPMWEFVGDARSVISGVPYTTMSVAAGDWGFDGFGNAVDDSLLQNPSFVTNTNGLSKLSIVALVTLHSVVTEASTIFKADNSISAGIQDSSSGTVRNLLGTTGVNGWTAANDFSFGEIKTKQQVMLGFTWDGDNLRHIYNDRMSPSYVVNGTITDSAVTTYVLYNPGKSVYLNATISSLLVYNGYLSNGQVSYLYDNPYALIQPPTFRTYFIPSGDIPTFNLAALNASKPTRIIQ